MNEGDAKKFLLKKMAYGNSMEYCFLENIKSKPLKPAIANQGHGISIIEFIEHLNHSNKCEAVCDLLMRVKIVNTFPAKLQMLDGQLSK